MFIGSSGALSNDTVLVSPVGKSKTGGTGVKVQTTLNRVNAQTTYSQSFTSIDIFLQNGNETVQFTGSLSLGAIVSAGNGNESIQLGNGNNIVTLGAGNDVVQAGC